MSGYDTQDRRKRHELDQCRTKMWYANALRMRRGLPSERSVKPDVRPLQGRMVSYYERGEKVPRDGPGSYVEKLEAAVPGSAALFRSPVWNILKGEPPSTAHLANFVSAAPVGNDSGKLLTTFADVESMLVRLELSRANGRNSEFAESVAAVGRSLPYMRFIPEIGSEVESFSAAVEQSLVGWRDEVEKRRRLDFLDMIAASNYILEQQHYNLGEPKSRVPPPQRYVFLSLSLGFLFLASLAKDSFSQIATMLMFVVYGICAVPPNFNSLSPKPIRGLTAMRAQSDGSD